VKKDTKVAIKAYGIKMVYVAEGAFDLGSGGTETGAGRIGDAGFGTIGHEQSSCRNKDGSLRCRN
jgi:hypothetical protein